MVKVLLLFGINVEGSIEIELYTFLRYIEATLLIDTLDGTLGCVCVTWSTGDEMDPSLRRDTDIMERRGLGLED